jgi:nicotinate-nucleotide adenylyltransferase
LIGIFGGTFDPVHYGHLEPAAEVLRALALDHIRFLPNNIPPHREAPWLTAEQRQTLLKKAIEPVDGFELDTRELERSGKSYMVDTLASLRSDFPEYSFCLIMGMDVFEGLPEWHRWQDLLTLAHIVVMHRPGKSLHDVNSKQASEVTTLLKNRQVKSTKLLQNKAAGSIFLHPISQLDISASKIREMVAKGKNPRYLLPDVVLQMVKVQKIYKTG